MQLPKGLIAVEPKSGRYKSLEAAVIDGGGTVVPIARAEALVWADPTESASMGPTVKQNPHLQWIALPFAGIENFVEFLDADRVWTAAKGVYARPVAEHALAMGLAGLRNIVGYGRAQQWSEPVGHNLFGGQVVIFGAGGITEELLPLLEPFGCEVTVVRRKPNPVAGATRVVTLEDRLEVLRDADLVILALALTPETKGVIGRAELAAMKRHAWLVNVARGGHIDTEALVEALAAKQIGGAALDVTEPEPLPGTHPLWHEPRALITPHVGNTPEMGIPLLAGRVRTNVERFMGGQELVGIVDIGVGY